TAGISSTFPAIKTYKSSANVLQTIAEFQLLTIQRPHIIFKINDTVGDKTDGYAYETTLSIKDSTQNLLYELKFYDMGKEKKGTEILLIGAHDMNRNQGGYGINAIGMKPLLTNFQSEILVSLKNKGLNLKSM
ncbi:MAG TPA: hypothetical protein VJ844_09135, partial [Mucilaginibacter sp.]|nr:hypothetical protein [Mucilaginibacter sp.]